MRKRIPPPVSGGLILSYKCPSECRHCIYGCSPGWSADWISEADLERILSQLSGRILSSRFGPRATGLNEGLHFSGGEPFSNFDLLLEAVEMARKMKIPSTFVETNCFWCRDEKTTKDKLKALKKKGLKGIMISVNPFYLEFVPFERTEIAIRAGLDVFGNNVMVYQIEYYRRFMEWGIKGRVPFGEYLAREKKESLLNNVEFMMMGRAPYRLKEVLRDFYPMKGADHFLTQPCSPPFVRSVHNHFDNYGNYVPGFCGGISYGDCRELDDLLREGVDPLEKPVLGYLMDEDMAGLLAFANERGFKEDDEGYFSRCHLCMQIRRHLNNVGGFMELAPREFYEHLA